MQIQSEVMQFKQKAVQLQGDLTAARQGKDQDGTALRELQQKNGELSREASSL